MIKCADSLHNFGPIVGWKLFPNMEGADFWKSSCLNPGCDACVLQTIPDEVKPVREGEPFRATKTQGATA